jgi:transposase
MSSQDPKFAVRYQMVMSALSKGIRPTMRDFRCSRNTVRLWLRRYQEQGLAGLEERSRAPHHIPHKTPPEVEQQVVEARDAIPCFGPRRLKRYFDLPCSTGAIARILKQSGRSQRRKKPRPPARSLAAEKLSWPAFGLLQVDVKDLSDLPGYRELIPFGLPRYQFTARIVPEGGIWLAFSAVNDSTYALLFGDRLLAHLAACGVKLEELTVQTDNGSEFGGAWNRRRTPPAFTRLVEQKYRCRRHRFNPPHRSTYNSDVEAVHGLMEQEFYQLEPFRGDLQRFLNQAWTYQLWFNYLRENSAKGHRTPDQLRAERAPWVHPKVYALPPVLLSSLSAQDLPSPRQNLGQDLPGHVKSPMSTHSDPRWL